MAEPLQDNLRHQLRQLGMSERNYRTLALLPLVYVAWADGTIQDAERAKITQIAETRGLLVNGGDSVLRRWLEHAPPADERAMGLKTLVELARRKRGDGVALSVNELDDLLNLSLEVAEAAGGLFGIAFTVSSTERACLEELADALSIDSGQSWKELVEDLDD